MSKGSELFRSIGTKKTASPALAVSFVLCCRLHHGMHRVYDVLENL